MNAPRALWLLPLVALAGALLLAGIDAATRGRVAQNERRAEEQMLLDILTLPAAQRASIERVAARADTESLGLRAPEHIYLARAGGRPYALIVPVVARDGYGGDIDLIVAVTADGRVAGARVIQQHETAGFGDRIERDGGAWIAQFIDKSLQNPEPERWRVKSDGGAFDQITGATITSRAVVNAVRQALQYVAAHRAELLRDSATEERPHE